mgnify:CR=1 FL=1
MTISKSTVSVLFLLLAMIYAQSVLACKCMYRGKFSKYTASTDMGIVRAKITSYGPKLPHGTTLHESMAVEVIAVIKGNYIHRELHLLGDPGNRCRDYVNSDRFQIGSEHFFAISGEKMVQPLGGCGESSVVINDNIIKGMFWENNKAVPYTIDLETFMESLKTP